MHRVVAGALLLTITALMRPVFGQESVGVIVDLAGAAEVAAGANWESASVGTPVRIGSHLRTGTNSRVHLALHDGTSVHFGARTEAVIDRHQFDPTAGRYEVVISLVRGQVRPVVGDRTGKNKGHVSVTSATATADTEAAEFVVEYDEPGAVTHVTSVRGPVAVHSTLDPGGSEVLVTSEQVTSVRKGAGPGPLRTAERLALTRFGQEEGVLGRTLPEAVLWAQHMPNAGSVSPHESLVGVLGVSAPAARQAPGRSGRTSSVREGNDVGAILGSNLANRVQVGIDLGPPK